MLTEMRRHTEDVIRYYGELDRRIASAGMNGIAGLLTSCQQVETALASVTGQELEWMVAEVKHLLEQLVAVDANLERLRALKAHLSDGGGDPTVS